MNTFLVFVGDDDFCRLLPEELSPAATDNGRVKVMAFPPRGIQTLAPVLRQRGHQVLGSRRKTGQNASPLPSSS